MNGISAEPIETVASPIEMDTNNPLRGKTAAVRRHPTKERLQKLQTVFNTTFRSRTEPVKHDSVSVLLLSWEREKSDMDVSEEVCPFSQHVLNSLLMFFFITISAQRSRFDIRKRLSLQCPT